MIPHITDEIKASIRRVAREDVDIVIVEIGGTVGDIESLPFLEAIRQLRKDVGKDNVIYVHLTLVPFIQAAAELKTKATQHSVKELRAIGIQPDILLCRTDQGSPAHAGDQVQDRAVLRRRGGGGHHRRATWTRSTRCRWPSTERGSTRASCKLLGLPARPVDLSRWEEIVRRIKSPAAATAASPWSASTSS